MVAPNGPLQCVEQKGLPYTDAQLALLQDFF